MCVNNITLQVFRERGRGGVISVYKITSTRTAIEKIGLFF